MTYKDAILRCARKEHAFYTDRSGTNHEVMINRFHPISPLTLVGGYRVCMFEKF